MKNLPQNNKREIKFRGLTVVGNWQIGNLAVLTKEVNGVETGSYISNSIGIPFSYHIRPETIGQFTGLEDKNGVDIYEGDILMIPEFYETPEMNNNNMRNWLVVFEYSMFTLVNNEDPLYADSGNLQQEYNSYNGNVEIIGNIHQNPELLK